MRRRFPLRWLRPSKGLLVAMGAVAVAQIAAFGIQGPRAESPRFVTAGQDLGSVVVRQTDGLPQQLGMVGPALLLVFDPECAHSRQIASVWSDWLKATSTHHRVVAVSSGTVSEAAAYARASDWPVQVVAIDLANGLEQSRALVSRTPWVFAIDDQGRVLDEGHGSRLEEVARALGRIRPEEQSLGASAWSRPRAPPNARPVSGAARMPGRRSALHVFPMRVVYVHDDG